MYIVHVLKYSKYLTYNILAGMCEVTAEDAVPGVPGTVPGGPAPAPTHHHLLRTLAL